MLPIDSTQSNIRAPQRPHSLQHATSATGNPIPPQIATIATLHEVPRYSIGATLPYFMHNSAQFLRVVHPASSTAFQQLGCVSIPPPAEAAPLHSSETRQGLTHPLNHTHSPYSLNPHQRRSHYYPHPSCYQTGWAHAAPATMGHVPHS